MTTSITTSFEPARADNRVEHRSQANNQTRSKETAMNVATRHKDSYGFQLIFATTFIAFFAVAIIDRLLPLRWILGFAKSENYIAVFSEAKLAAATYTPFAFMG